jgi:hypothetical protein
MTKQMIEAMIADDLDIVIVPEKVEELTEGALIIRSSLVTESLRFNSVHAEVIGDFTILYH